MAFTDVERSGWGHFYKISLVDVMGHVGVPTGVFAPLSAVDDGTPAVRQVADLVGNSPNPFNPATEIHFAVHRDSHVLLEVSDLGGRKAGTLVDRRMSRGDYAIPFDGERLSSGIYLCRLTAGQTVLSTKMTLVK